MSSSGHIFDMIARMKANSRRRSRSTLYDRQKSPFFSKETPGQVKRKEKRQATPEQLKRMRAIARAGNRRHLRLVAFVCLLILALLSLVYYSLFCDVDI